jgi:hypothetical protein
MIATEREFRKTSRSRRLESCRGAAAAATLFLAILAPSLSTGDSPSSPFPGLELVPSKNVSTLYRRPDADASVYGKINVGEPAIEFSKNWNPRNYGGFGLSAARRSAGSSTMQWSTSVSNRAAANAMLKGWARQVKRELDAARAK